MIAGRSSSGARHSRLPREGSRACAGASHVSPTTIARPATSHRPHAQRRREPLRGQRAAQLAPAGRPARPRRAARARARGPPRARARAGRAGRRRARVTRAETTAADCPAARARFQTAAPADRAVVPFGASEEQLLESQSNEVALAQAPSTASCSPPPRASSRLPLAAAAERPLRIDDIFQIKDVSDPQLSPDGRFVAYTVTDARPRQGPLGPRRLHGRSRRRRAAPAHLEQEERIDAALQPGRPVDRVPLEPRGRARCGLPAEPPGRRGGQADGLQGLRIRPRLVPRLEAAGARRVGRGSRRSRVVGRRVGRRGGLARKGEGGEADRCAPRPVQARRHRLPGRAALARPRLRRRRRRRPSSSPRAPSTTRIPRGRRTASGSPSSATARFPTRTSRRTATSSWSRRGRARSRAESPSARARPRVRPGARTASGSPSSRAETRRTCGTARATWRSCPPAGGAPKALTEALDRNVLSPRFAPDGRSLLFVIEDGGNQHLARVGSEGGTIERVVAGEREVQAFDVAKGGAIVVLESSLHQPPEISAVASGGLRRITRVNDEFLKGIRLGAVERFQAKGKDGTRGGRLPDAAPGLHARLADPGDPPHPRRPGLAVLDSARARVAGARGLRLRRDRRQPARLDRLRHRFQPRDLRGLGQQGLRRRDGGGGPRGREGGRRPGPARRRRLELRRHPDQLRGRQDPSASRPRSPARAPRTTSRTTAPTTTSTNTSWSWACPGRQRDAYLSLSSPFFDVEKITTPTLFLCGALDVNVPLLNSEQQYQALRRVGKAETELVVYPDQWHTIRRPSYQKDKLERYLAWYDRFLRPGVVTAARAGSGDAAAKPEATSLAGVPLFAPALTRGAAEDPRRRPRRGDRRVSEEPGQRRRCGLARAPLRLPRPLPRRDRHLHPRPRETPERRAAAPPPRPPLHLGARVRQGRSRTCRAPPRS